MIGVCPCIKKEISTMEAAMNTSISSIPGTPGGTPELERKRLSKIRPLSTTTLSPLVRNASLSEPNKENTPKKKDSVVGKALDYVFGW